LEHSDIKLTANLLAANALLAHLGEGDLDLAGRGHHAADLGADLAGGEARKRELLWLRAVTSFVPVTSEKPRNGTRTDEQRCVETTTYFAEGPFGKQLVRVGPDKA
jgi:hypothetical protein